MNMPTLVIMAGGTGGHIMPGLAVAHEMKARGWRVLWMGNPDKMEGQLVPAEGFEMLPMRFAGLRGKGAAAMLKLPFTLASACMQAKRAFSHSRADVVLGMGGYVAFPGGLMARMAGVPLVVHEQNAVAGTANRWLARFARKVLAGFPGALHGALMVGNPVRPAFTALPSIAERYGARSGPLRVLVVGGSLGASVLNEVVPQALARMEPSVRPVVTHQAGAQHIEKLEERYREHGIEANCVAFINNMAEAYAQADVVICRAGAMTVAEVAAAGVAALFVPLPHAIDDHQTANARYLADCKGAWLRKQPEFTAEWLAKWLASLERDALKEVALHAHEHACLSATQLIADACEQVARRTS